MKFTLEIDEWKQEAPTDPYKALACILRDAAVHCDAFEGGTIRDYEGNIVGTFKLEEED